MHTTRWIQLHNCEIPCTIFWMFSHMMDLFSELCSMVAFWAALTKGIFLYIRQLHWDFTKSLHVVRFNSTQHVVLMSWLDLTAKLIRTKEMILKQNKIHGIFFLCTINYFSKSSIESLLPNIYWRLSISGSGLHFS